MGIYPRFDFHPVTTHIDFTMNKEYVLLVSGGRDFDDIEFIIDKLDKIHIAFNITLLVNGGARGVDEISSLWATEMSIPFTEYTITNKDWDRLGKKAGILRNQEMLEKAKPDGVICFPGGRGTEDMFRRASQVPWLDVWKSEKILFRKEDQKHFFLSNFALGFDFADPDTGEWWMTSEHYYQAGKTPVESERSEIQNAPDPKAAKDAGQNVNYFSDWDTRKIEVMRRALKLKFYPGSKAAELLLDTDWDYLVEYAPWGDVFWGVDRNHIGQNHLGQLLMERRSELAGQVE